MFWPEMGPGSAAGRCVGGWLLALLDARRGEKGPQNEPQNEVQNEAGHEAQNEVQNGPQNEAGHEAQNGPLSAIRLSRMSRISRISRISHIAKSAGVMLMVAALVMWALTPAPDGALLARGRTPILVLAGPNGQATQIAPSTPRARRTGTGTGGRMLSDFTKSTASLLLAQEIIDPVTAVDAGTDAVKKPTMSNSADDRRSPIMLLGRHGQKLAVARHRAALTRACRSGADLVLSFAAPRYACQVPVFTVTRLWDANFLLLFNADGSITVQPSPADSRRTGVTDDRVWPTREGSRK